ncbi:MAG: hypothetical protein NTU94_18160 [Planctomycetota bacterium]|nr:hypothetical protein [Planctomycetota bacterium]
MAKKGRIAVAVVVVLLLTAVCRAEEWQAPQVQFSRDAKHPVVACTPEELARLRAAWSQTGPAHDALAAAPQPRTEVCVGDGVGASITDRVPLGMLTHRGTAARFACVLEPVPTGRQTAVTAVATDEAAGAIRVTITSAGATHTFTLSPDGEVTVTDGTKVVLKTSR